MQADEAEVPVVGPPLATQQQEEAQPSQVEDAGNEKKASINNNNEKPKANNAEKKPKDAPSFGSLSSSCEGPLLLSE